MQNEKCKVQNVKVKGSEVGLDVRTKRFALSVIELCSGLPKSMVEQTLGRQLLRSGTSVGAQYREGMRAKSRADFVSKLQGSLQELEETRYWLDLLRESRLAATSAIEPVRQEADQLLAMLVASVNTAKRNKPAG
ncbi:MAG: four helix bundle protein [Burkholderiales bacterium]|nr:four helix bundle protein [Burkholderiales bacterium]